MTTPEREDQKVKSMKAHHEIYKNERYEIERILRIKEAFSYSRNPPSHSIHRARLCVNSIMGDVYTATPLKVCACVRKWQGSGMIKTIRHVTSKAGQIMSHMVFKAHN